MSMMQARLLSPSARGRELLPLSGMVEPWRAEKTSTERRRLSRVSCGSPCAIFPSVYKHFSPEVFGPVRTICSFGAHWVSHLLLSVGFHTTLVVLCHVPKLVPRPFLTFGPS